MIKKAGVYKATATEVGLFHSQKRGTPCVGVMFQVMEGEYAGHKVKWEGWLTEKTQERTIESLQHCGWQGDDLAELARANIPIALPTPVELVVEMEPDQKDPEKEWPKVQWVNKIGVGPKFSGEAMDAVQAAEFGKRFRGLAHALRAKNGAPPVTKTKDDEIPF